MGDEQVKRGQEWTPKRTGWSPNVRVMAVVDGYVMYRMLGCFPDVHITEDFVRHFRMVTMEKREKPTQPHERLGNNR